MYLTLTIIGLVFTALGVVYMGRQSARESQRMRQQQVNDAVATALAPVTAELMQARQDIRDKDRRIEQLEDELRRRP